MLLFHIYLHYFNYSISADFFRQINPEVMDFTTSYLQYYLKTSIWNFVNSLQLSPIWSRPQFNSCSEDNKNSPFWLQDASGEHILESFSVHAVTSILII